MEEDIEGLKRLFYANALTQYGKRKLIGYYEQRIKELEEKNKKKSIEIICYQEELENSIPVSLVEEKIEELKTQRRELGFKTYLRREDMLNDDRKIVREIEVLQELLEKR